MSEETVIVISLKGTRVSIEKGSETIALDMMENGKVHIWATHKHGGYTVATLKFLKDEVVKVEE